MEYATAYNRIERLWEKEYDRFLDLSVGWYIAG
jgi:hypothetical protein